jgi:hypothetical protein
MLRGSANSYQYQEPNRDGYHDWHEEEYELSPIFGHILESDDLEYGTQNICRYYPACNRKEACMFRHIAYGMLACFHSYDSQLVSFLVVRIV